MTADEFNTGGCNGCRYHKKDLEETFWRYTDGTLRNDLCVRTGEEVPVFNTGCGRYCA